MQREMSILTAIGFKNKGTLHLIIWGDGCACFSNLSGRVRRENRPASVRHCPEGWEVTVGSLRK